MITKEHCTVYCVQIKGFSVWFSLLIIGKWYPPHPGVGVVREITVLQLSQPEIYGLTALWFIHNLNARIGRAAGG